MVLLEQDFSLKSLREQVYSYLRDQMDDGKLRPGVFLNLNEISRELGISRTPLRDALFQLEAEGFVTIFPRRGVIVNELTLEKIRNIYEILGALEAATLVLVSVRLRDSDADAMERYNEQMRKALEQNNFSLFYDANLRFHNVYLDLSNNTEMARAIKIRKERLYDFPRNKAFVKEWELHSLSEHEEMISLLRKKDFNGMADYIRDVHWSFSVQERFIRKYYFANYTELDISQEGDAAVE
ncbi:MAG: GntR family transcriptional regulator [Synergistes sp.]|nr:GntR family transcriptional regulator [Synergistes sp.]